MTNAEHRRAGHVGIPMRWPSPLPWIGDHLINRNRDRARFGYRIVEVERWDPPRGAVRFNCRLWCERVAPQDVPVSEPGDRNQTHIFWWFPRRRTKRTRTAPV